MFLKAGFLSLLSIIVFCESSILDSLKKCSMRDAECQRALYQSVVGDIAKTGIKELGIPPIDPIELKNASVSVLGLLEFTLVEGTAAGASNCTFNSFMTDIEKGHSSMDMLCNVVIKGRYKVYSDSELVRPIFAQKDIRGDGLAKIKLEKLHIKLDFDFEVIKGRDKEIYFKPFYQNTTAYSYAVLGKALFYLDHFHIGDEDMSKEVTDFLNKNTQFVIQSFSEPFMDKALGIFSVLTLKFFDAVPAKKIISEDLTPYLNNLIKSKKA